MFLILLTVFFQQFFLWLGKGWREAGRERMKEGEGGRKERRRKKERRKGEKGGMKE